MKSDFEFGLRFGFSTKILSLREFLVCFTAAVLLAFASNAFSQEQEKPTHQETPNELGLISATPFPNISSNLPAHFPVPGGIAIIPLRLKGAIKPVVKFGSRKVLVVPYQNQWQAIVGLPGNILPGNYILGTIDEEEEPRKIPLKIIPLPAPALNRNESQTKLISGPNRSANPIQLDPSLAASDYINPSMIVPREIIIEDPELSPSFIYAPVIESIEMIPYGSILRQNKIVDHHYLSYLGTPQSQVYAPAPGVVVKVVEDNKYNGQIYIHHGGGIVSVLGNLEKVSVQEGQRLDRGEQIGRADYDGSLDRSRVDFGLSLNGFLIDPLQFPSTP